MNFLVTGAAGFLGSALANRLVREGHQVRGLDDLSSGDPGRLAPDVLFTRGDVTDRPKLWTLLQDVDCVYHLAARVSVPESVLYPREYNAVNVGGAVSVMEAMRDVGVKRVVLISSGAVYGDQPDQPMREDAVPNPRSPYAVSKLAAEYYVRTIGSLWGIETVALRVFNAYGPGQPIPAAPGPPPAGRAALPAAGSARRDPRHPRPRRSDARFCLPGRRRRSHGRRPHPPHHLPARDQYRHRRPYHHPGAGAASAGSRRLEGRVVLQRIAGGQHRFDVRRPDPGGAEARFFPARPPRGGAAAHDRPRSTLPVGAHGIGCPGPVGCRARSSIVRPCSSPVSCSANAWCASTAAAG